MKFAFLILGAFDEARDRAQIAGGAAQIVGVPDVETACRQAQRLMDEGIGCIELCGTFGEAGARRVMQATGGRIPVGYVTHAAEMDPVFEAAFGSGRKEHA